MSKTYTIEISDAQSRALEFIAVDVQEWIDNFVEHRANVAIDEIVTAEVKRRLDAGEPIPSSRDEIVLTSPMQTAAERQAAHDAAVAARAGSPT